jgi:hypothetical protein
MARASREERGKNALVPVKEARVGFCNRVPLADHRFKRREGHKLKLGVKLDVKSEIVVAHRRGGKILREAPEDGSWIVLKDVTCSDETGRVRMEADDGTWVPV